VALLSYYNESGCPKVRLYICGTPLLFHSPENNTPLLSLLLCISIPEAWRTGLLEERSGGRSNFWGVHHTTARCCEQLLPGGATALQMSAQHQLLIGYIKQARSECRLIRVTEHLVPLQHWPHILVLAKLSFCVCCLNYKHNVQFSCSCSHNCHGLSDISN